MFLLLLVGVMSIAFFYFSGENIAGPVYNISNLSILSAGSSVGSLVLSNLLHYTASLAVLKYCFCTLILLVSYLSVGLISVVMFNSNHNTVVDTVSLKSFVALSLRDGGSIGFNSNLILIYLA